MGDFCLPASVSGECPVFHHLYLLESEYTMEPRTLMGGGLKQSELCVVCQHQISEKGVTRNEKSVYLS